MTKPKSINLGEKEGNAGATDKNVLCANSGANVIKNND